MTTVGDLIAGGSGGTPNRLPIGSNGQVLGVATGNLAYISPLTNPMTTTGDIIVGGSAGAANRLAAGANGLVLTLVSGTPAWAPSGGKAVTSGLTFSGSGYTFSLTTYNVFSGAASGNCPFTYPSAVAGKEFWIVHQQPAVGGPYAPTFPSNVYWAGNAPPVFTTIPGFIDRIYNICVDGSTWEADITPSIPILLTISTDGSVNYGGSLSSAVYTQAVTAIAGDCFIVGVSNYSGSSSSYTTTLADSGSLCTWSELAGPFNNNSILNGVTTSLWSGVVNSAGSTNITATFSSAPSNAQVISQQFKRTGGIWAVDGGGNTGTSTASPITMPSQTPTGPNEMYIGFYRASSSDTVSASGTSGYTTEQGSASWYGLVFNTNVTNGVAQAPTLVATGTVDAVNTSVLIKI